MNQRGEITGCIVEGPISFDLAMIPKTAGVKKFTSPVAGDADIILAPGIAAGNMLIKSLYTFGGCLLYTSSLIGREFVPGKKDTEESADSVQGGIIITNPPYGERIGDRDSIDKLYRGLADFLKNEPTWSCFAITPDKTIENRVFGRPADRRRKLFNGRMEVCYYQYHGIKPER